MQAITGTIIQKYPIQQVTDKFSKREFVIKTNEDKFPQEILVQLTQDNCSKLDGFNVGDQVIAQYNLRGRGYVNKEGVKKYFNSIEIWSIKKDSGAITAEPKMSDYRVAGGTDDDNDGLTF